MLHYGHLPSRAELLSDWSRGSLLHILCEKNIAINTPFVWTLREI